LTILPFISVIIPTYNRIETLTYTIDSFLNQSYSKDNYEIIISDNNSTDSTKDVVSEYVTRNPNRIRYLYEKRQGVHWARNSAAKIAHGDILYFTDDDMIADRLLLREILKSFEYDAKVASATGKVLPKWEIDPPNWVMKYCNNWRLSLNNPQEDFIISKSDCSVFSCHQAILKEVFIQSGGFNPENTKGQWLGDGETGLNIKIKELGYKFGYNGLSVIYHVIPASRMTQSYFNKRMANQGNCDCYSKYRKYIFTTKQLLGEILKHTIGILISGIKCFVNLVSGNDLWHVNYAMLFYYVNKIKYNFKLIFKNSFREFVLKRDWITE